MRTLAILIAGVFSFFLIDLNLFKNTRTGINISNILMSLDIADHKVRRKRKTRKYKNKKYKRRKLYRVKHLRLRGTCAKDKRYSNQKSLRRMYRNV